MGEVIIHLSINVGGGITTVMTSLAQAQLQTHKKVFLATIKSEVEKLSAYNNNKSNIMVEAIDEYKIKVPYVIKGTKIRELSNKMQELYPNDKIIIICHGIGAIGLFGKICANLLVVLHGHPEDYNIIKRIVHMLILKRLKKHNIKIISCSEECANYHKKVYGIEQYYIRNGVSVTGIKNKCERNFTVSYASNLINGKGFKYLLEACNILQKSGENNILFRFAGSNDEQEYFDNYVKENGLQKRVLFIGEIKDYANKEMPNSDLLVLPSTMEGLPMCLLEAQAYGIPILATAVGGIPEVLHDDVNGYFIKRDGQDIADKILKCLDKENYKRLSENSLNNYKENFTLKKMVDEYDKIVENCCEK